LGLPRSFPTWCSKAGAPALLCFVTVQNRIFFTYLFAAMFSFHKLNSVNCFVVCHCSLLLARSKPDNCHLPFHVVGSVLVGRHSCREDMPLWSEYYGLSGCDVVELDTFCSRLKFVDEATVLDSPRNCCSCFRLKFREGRCIKIGRFSLGKAQKLW